MALKVIVQNFQSITEAKIPVDGVTLLQGDSNSGKSATLRALEAACTNRFMQGQVKFGEDHATIKIKTPESNDVLTVVRPWTGSVKVKLGDEVFTKLGRTLPSQVSSFLNLGSIDLMGDNYSLNFHPQFQKPLLLEYSQQKVVEILSASTALDDLKETKEALLTKRQQNKGAISLVQGIIDDTTTKLHELEDQYNSLTPDVFTLRSLSAELEVLESTLSDLTALASIKLPNVSSLESLVSYYSDMIKLSESHSYVVALESIKLPDLTPLQNRVDQLSELAPLSDNLSILSNTLEDLSWLSTTLSSYNNVCSFIDLRKDLPDTYPDPTPLDSLDTSLALLSNIDTRISQLENIVTNNICPICGAPLNSHSHD